MPKKGYKQTEEHKRKTGLALKGRPRPESVRKKISEAQMGSKNHAFGKKLSEETKRKISEAGKGRRHSEESKRKMSEASKGKVFSALHRKRIGEASKGRIAGAKNPRWNNGTKIHNKGYLLIRKPSHPLCTKDGYVYAHRLVVETKIGRFLKPKEACHHINKIKDDNRPENLIAFRSNAAHVSFERLGKDNPSDIIFDGRDL